jgi:hypothetical protein
MQIEIDPNEREIGSWFLSGSSRLNVNLRGQGAMLYLDSNPLAEARDISLIGGLRVFFDPEDGELSSNSVLLNYFSPLPATILAELPVAYDAETGTLYNYGIHAEGLDRESVRISHRDLRGLEIRDGRGNSSSSERGRTRYGRWKRH